MSDRRLKGSAPTESPSGSRIDAPSSESPRHRGDREHSASPTRSEAQSTTTTATTRGRRGSFPDYKKLPDGLYGCPHPGCDFREKRPRDVRDHFRYLHFERASPPSPTKALSIGNDDQAAQASGTGTPTATANEHQCNALKSMAFVTNLFNEVRERLVCPQCGAGASFVSHGYHSERLVKGAVFRHLRIGCRFCRHRPRLRDVLCGSTDPWLLDKAKVLDGLLGDVKVARRTRQAKKQAAAAAAPNRATLAERATELGLSYLDLATPRVAAVAESNSYHNVYDVARGGAYAHPYDTVAAGPPASRSDVAATGGYNIEHGRFPPAAWNHQSLSSPTVDGHPNHGNAFPQSQSHHRYKPYPYSHSAAASPHDTLLADEFISTMRYRSLAPLHPAAGFRHQSRPDWQHAAAPVQFPDQSDWHRQRTDHDQRYIQQSYPPQQHRWSEPAPSTAMYSDQQHHTPYHDVQYVVDQRIRVETLVDRAIAYDHRDADRTAQYAPQYAYHHPPPPRVPSSEAVDSIGFHEPLNHTGLPPQHQHSYHVADQGHAQSIERGIDAGGPSQTRNPWWLEHSNDHLSADRPPPRFLR